MSKKVVVIDAGHGGSDPGAIGHGKKESKIVLDTAIVVKRELEKYKELRVVMTRTTDNFVTLKQRSVISNRARADVFLSIHVNSSSNSTATGYETFRYPNNKSQTVRLQRTIHNEVMGVYKKYGVRDRGMKTKNLSVLRETQAPAVLTENLFISNIKDVKVMNKTIRLVGEALARGILKYLGIPIKKQGSVTSKPQSKPGKEIVVGSKVRIKKTADRYATGEPIRDIFKGVLYTVERIDNGNVLLLKEIKSKVYKKDVE